MREVLQIAREEWDRLPLRSGPAPVHHERVLRTELEELVVRRRLARWLLEDHVANGPSSRQSELANRVLRLVARDLWAGSRDRDDLVFDAHPGGAVEGGSE